MELWGKDHWSLFAYLVYLKENNLTITNNRLRCNNQKHPNKAHYFSDDVFKYGTRLNNGTVLDGHDDWDCIDDFVNQKLINIDLSFTVTGIEVAKNLTAHKLNGGKFNSFKMIKNVE